MAIGRALAEVDDGVALTASQLEDMIGKHQSNLKKAAEQLVAAGVLKPEREPPRPNGQPGRRAQTAFAFAEGERERFEYLMDDAHQLDFPEVGTHFVFVDTQDRRDDLWKVLSQTGVASGLDRVWHLEGERREMMFAFNGPNAVDDSMDFFEVLSDAELNVRRQSVSQSSSSRDMRKVARRRRERVQRSRQQLGLMQTAPLPES